MMTLFYIAAVLLAISFSTATVAAGEPPYTNYTVGGAAGWRFDARSKPSAANYSAWAANKSFYLGDYLIFNIVANTTVIQTYNATTYRLCNADADDSNLTYVYVNLYEAKKVEVMLTKEGANYFFSDEDDGLWCASGMRFSIKVQLGQGLPMAIYQPPPPPADDNAPEDTASPRNKTLYKGTNGIGGSPPIGVVALVGSFVATLGLILSLV